MTSNPDASAAREAASHFKEVYDKIRCEVGRCIVGQDDVIEGVLTALLAGGHVLLEGVPGLGKTLLVKTLGEAVDLDFSRIQFTPDMMPADIQGTMVLVDAGLDGAGAEGQRRGHELRFQEGPLIANLVLADEINRATPKTQSALLEAMQEKQLSVGRRTIKLEEPYCVMATQNPIEQEGTYPLPEAQLDRFLLKLIVDYPAEHEYHEILNRTTSTEETQVQVVSSAQEVSDLRQTVLAVPVPEHVQTYAVRLVMGTQPGGPYTPDIVQQNSLLGSSPRGAQGLLLAGKVKALLAGRFAVSSDDIRAVAAGVLRHRIAVNYHGQSDGITSDALVDAVIEHVSE